MPQLFGMLIAHTNAACISQFILWSIRYSGRHRIIYANRSKLRISPVPEVECCQKLSCSPHINEPNKGGIQLTFIVRNECSLCSLCLCSFVRSCGSRQIERASNPKVRAPNNAESAFIAVGSNDAGSSLNGRVTK